MYQINTTTHEIIQLPSKRFAELGFKECEHLQEWIAKCPSSLGEEFLFFQKQFDGFDKLVYWQRLDDKKASRITCGESVYEDVG